MFRTTGNLTVKAKTIEIIGVGPNLIAPSGIFSQTVQAEGNGGNLIINSDLLHLKNAGVISVSNIFGVGNAGNLTIETNSLFLENGSQISAGTFGKGNSGILKISAKTIEIIGLTKTPNRNISSGLFTSTEGEGNSGDLTIATINLLISDGATISADSDTTGNSGNINLFVDNTRILNNGSIVVNNKGTGISGNININGNSVRLNRGTISAESNSKNSGNINIKLEKVLTLGNSSNISTTSGRTRGEGNGGNITIDSPLIFAFPRNNQVEANAFSGSGGNININTRAIFGYPQFLTITASSNLGIDGNVNISGLNDELSRGAVELQSSPINAEDIIAKDICGYENDEVAKGSSFTIIGKGGIAPNPLGAFEEDNLPLVEWSSRSSTQARLRESNITPVAKVQKQKKVKQAVGWWRKSDGTIVLTANPKAVKRLDIPMPSNCQ